MVFWFLNEQEQEKDSPRKIDYPTWVKNNLQTYISVPFVRKPKNIELLCMFLRYYARFFIHALVFGASYVNFLHFHYD